MGSKMQLVLLAALLAVLFHAAESGRVLQETSSNPAAPAFEAAGGDLSTPSTDDAVPADTRADGEYVRVRELSVTIDGEAHASMKPRYWPPPPPLNPYRP